MTDPKLHPKEPETVSCDICLKEIPADVATRDEGTEYVYHFCGQECFDKWQHQGEKEKKEEEETTD